MRVIAGRCHSKRKQGGIRAATVLISAFILLLRIASPMPALAEGTLRVGWIGSMSPTLDVGEETTSLQLELARLLAEAGGYDVEFVRFATPEQKFAALAAGDIDLAPGVVDPGIYPGVLPSNRISDGSVFLFVRSDAPPDLSLETTSGLTLAALPFTLTEGITSAASDHVIVEYRNAPGAVFDLLAGNVDGVIAPFADVFSAAHRAGVDHRVRTVDEALETRDRIVAVAPGRFDLLDDLNDAITALGVDGRLDEVGYRFFQFKPEPPPDILTVGVQHFPPYHVVRPDGSFTGFAVEALRDLADRIHLELRFVEIDVQEFGLGPGRGGYDLLPQAGISAQRQAFMDFTQPIERGAFSIFVAASRDTNAIAGLNDLQGDVVGVQAQDLARRIAEQHGGLDLAIYETELELVESLINGETDAFLYATETALRLADEQGYSDQIKEVEPPFHVAERGIALRFGLGQVRADLNAVLPAYLASDQFDALHRAWFDPAGFWTEERRRIAAAATGGVIAVLLGSQVWLSAVRRREQRHATALAELVEELEQSNRALDEFAHIASHDLREPLRGVSINAQFLLRETLSDGARARVERIGQLCHQSDHLIADLLAFAELGRAKGAPVAINIRSLIDDLRLSLKETIEAESAEVRVQGALPLVLGDQGRIWAVFQNLVMNAIKYNQSAEKRVEIGFEHFVELDGETFRNMFYVRDNGIGIQSRDFEKIFRIFSRLNPRNKYGGAGGTGAGLAFVKRIVDSYGGRLLLDSKVGKGSTFYFSLPLAMEGL